MSGSMAVLARLFVATGGVKSCVELGLDMFLHISYNLNILVNKIISNLIILATVYYGAQVFARAIAQTVSGRAKGGSK
jgi:hypothetical protein